MGRLFTAKNYNFRRIDEQGKLRQWRRGKIDEKVRVLCKPCNSGWMSSLEDEVRKTFSTIIREGGNISLLSRGRTLLARFTFKCAVVANYADPENGQPFFDTRERYRFKETLKLPPNVNMWIAAFDEPVGHHGISNWYCTSSSQVDIIFFTYTLQVGHLVVQLHLGKWKSLLHGGLDIPEVQPIEEWGSIPTRFWPNEGFPVLWPPALSLNAKTVHHFANRWRDEIRIATWEKPEYRALKKMMLFGY